MLPQRWRLAKPVLAVIDDDPTGAQSEAGVSVLVAWSPALLAQVAERRPRAVHLLTNSRALAPEAAYRVTREAAEAVSGGWPGTDIVLRGDSTLRGHLLEEYCGLRDAVFAGVDTALMLVPALPSAGRVTVGGVHCLQRGDRLVPLHETEYASDGGFSYTSARLLDWAQERSAGRLLASRGLELPLDRLRFGGPTAVAAALARAAMHAPAVFAPDARTDSDLDLLAAGLQRAREAGTAVIVRCAPAFVGRLARSAAQGLVPAPRARRGLLIACGSYVPVTTRQLAALRERRPGAFVEVQADALGAPNSEQVIAETIASASALLASDRLAVVTTSRRLKARGLAHAERIARGLAAIVAQLRGQVDVVISKGGVTSAINLRDGLGAMRAEVIGPMAAGISLWRVETPEREEMAFVVFPGNVGGDNALADVVDALAPA